MTVTSFGKTSNGASSTTSSADKLIASSATATATGTLTAGHARVWIDSGNTEVRMLCYADSSSAPGALLATSDEVILSATSEAVVDFTFSGAQQVAITSGTTYWIALCWDDPGAQNINFSRDGTASARVEANSFTYGTFPDPFGANTAQSGPIDAYLDVTAPATGGGTEGYSLLATVTGTSYLDTSIEQSSGQTLGVGGIPAPAPGAGVVLVNADSSSVLSISTSNRVYDGQGHEVPRINITADNVTVQNFVITGGEKYGVEVRGDNVTVQNCDFSGLLPTGDGDMNAISFFGDGFKMLYNEIGVSDFLVGTTSVGDSHTDAVQTWNNDPGESSSNVVIQGNYIKGPATSDARFIHQGVMAEGKSSTSGGGGGTGTSTGWLILDNTFEMSAENQIIKLDDVDDVDIARNTFIGSASSVFDIRATSTPVRIWSSNVWTAFTGTKPSTTAGDGPDGPARPGSSSSGEPVAYTYVVTAIDAAGNESGGGPPGGGTGGAPDTEAPTVPTNLTVTAGDGRLTIRWDASYDAVGVDHYTVYLDGAVTGYSVASGPTFATALVLVGLANGTEYSVRVSATDAAGNESALASAVLATPAAGAAAGAPMLPGRLVGGTVEVSVAWGADLTDDESGWTWTDVTDDVRFKQGISTSLGRNDESSTSNPAQMTLVLSNTSGDYSLGSGSANYPYVRRNTPVRVRVDPGDGAGARVVFLGFADGWTPGWDTLAGTVPVVSLSASGTLRRLSQGSAPITSAYRRVMTARSAVVAYWPMEEGKSAVRAPAIRGGDPLELEGTSPFQPPTSDIPNWQANSDFDCSAPLPTLGSAYLQADVDSYADTGASQVRFLLSIPDTGLPDGTVLMHVSMTGTIHRWDLTYGINEAGEESLGYYRYNESDGSLHSSNIIGFRTNGIPCRVSMDWTQSGSNIVWTLSTVAATPGASAFLFRQTLSGRTCGIVEHFEINPHSAPINAAIGHLTVENSISSLFSDTDALIAHTGDTVTGNLDGRLKRLCDENSVPLFFYGAGGTLGTIDQMGPQLVAPLLDLLRQGEVADQGQLWDGRNAGLQYTTRRRRELGTVKLAINAATGQLAPPFDPVDDDQRDRNKVTVTRLHGTTYTHEDSAGVKGTAAIGIYDDAVTVNTRWDDHVADYAEWFVLLGTQPGYRYPSVSVDLAASPELAAAVLDIIPGERIQVTNLDTTLAGFPDATVDLIVEGIAHELTTRSWRVTFRCSSYTPWATGLGG